MDTIGKGPAILSTCVKRWRFFACKVGFLLQDRTKFGTAGLFRQTEHAKAVIRTVLYTVQSLPKVKSLPHFFCMMQWVDCSNFSQIERLCTKILYSFCRTKKFGLQRLKELL